MKRVAFCWLLLSYQVAAAVITGTIYDPGGRPVAGANVAAGGSNSTHSAADGTFRLEVEEGHDYRVRSELPGFTPVERSVTVRPEGLHVDLTFTAAIAFHDSVTVTARAFAGDILNPDPGQNVVVRNDMLDSGAGRPGVPVSIPGIPVETASGGIKAPQYFAPGVAGDHGESIAQYFQVGSYLVPNNLSANAHGNGYADPNAIIPAVVETVQTDGGAFNIREGNHAVNLAAAYGFTPRIQPFLSVGVDGHDVDLIAGWGPSDPDKHAWIAIETAWGNGFLNTPEHRRQFKLNGYRVFTARKHTLTVFGAGYYGQSGIAGLIPIDAPVISDTIDSRQQDQSHTGEVAVNDIWHVGAGGDLHLSGFFRTYNLSLYSNFGDGLIRQSEFRTAGASQAEYVKRLDENLSILAGVDYSREAPRRLNLDRYAEGSGTVYGPFSQITSNNVTLNSVSFYSAVEGRMAGWIHYHLGWRRDQIEFDNEDRGNPANSFHRWVPVDSPKATVSLVAPGKSILPVISLSFGQAFIANDPRIGSGIVRGTPVSRAHSWQMVMSKTLWGTDFTVTGGRTTQEQTVAKIDPDSGLQFDEGPSRNRYVTVTARRRFNRVMLQSSISKADARDLAVGATLPEAPRTIFDVVAGIERLPWQLQARGEFEEVGRKPLGDGFVSTPVREFRGAVTRPFANGRLDAGVNFMLANGYTGQTTEVLALPNETNAHERVVGVRTRSYAAVLLRWRF